MVGLLFPVIEAGAGPGDRVPRRDTRHVGPDYNQGRKLPFADDVRSVAREALRASKGSAAAPEVGDQKQWLALDDAQGVIYLKGYRLRGEGENVEVWVARDRDKVSRRLNFLADDCRNGPRTTITDAQVDYLVDEFDTNIYPEESDAFSVPPERDGSESPLPEALGLPADYYEGDGDNIVVLVDNVRDQNFYDFNNEHNYTYIAGFFYSVFNEFLDRNVMTIDAYDWLHRTGATPDHEPVPGNNCTSAPARPFLYEGVFAHEYQHLLEYYEDPDELNWVNEGLSDWAQTLTGYVDPSVPIDDIDFDSHIQCFLGYLGEETEANPNPRGGGPENSLTLWGDQGDDEILCDYGAAYTMMELLASRYGGSFMTELHTDDGNGFDGLRAALAAGSIDKDAQTLLHEWAAMAALDGILDDGATLTGGAEADYKVPTLDATINWDTRHAYSRPGAPPNGSDYVRLRDATGSYLGAGDITDISFAGDQTLPPFRVQWKSDNKPPQHNSPALYSGSGANLDRSIVKRVRVPMDKPRLTFLTKWKIEAGWDFGFVQVSTDGGRTYRSLGNKDTTSVTDPGAIAAVKENVPGFTGSSKGWRTERFSLKRYAGQRIHLAFRYVTGPAVNPPGWWIDRVRVGKKRLTRGTSLKGWKTVTQVRPTRVEGYTVQLISYNEAGGGAANLETLELADGYTGALEGDDVAGAIGADADVVAAIVTYDEPTEEVTQYAPYELQVNGVLQPGG
ncbi:hypothetical protein BH24ACT26_BH24ACT26_12380 [soil metagenome]